MNIARRKSLSIALLVVLVLALTATAASAGGGAVATYEVTITNLTGGQPITPPVLVVHRQPINIFHVGQPASEGIQQLAENGNSGPLMAALTGNKHVYEFQQGGMPLVPAGTPGSTMFPDSATFTVTSAEGAKYLSVAGMLICTNDGFTGVDSLRLPKRVGDSTTAMGDAYDAGTEINTEYFGDIVPPCQGLIGVTGDPGTGMSNPALAEGGVITHHAGIMGGVDLLPGVHGWTDPVVAIVVTRVD